MRASFGLAAVLSALALVACGGDGGSSSTTLSGSGSATAPPPPSEETPDQGPGTSTGTGAGGGNPGASAGAGLSPREAIQGALASDDPDVACAQAVTDRYVLRGYGGADGCASAILSGGTAKSVETHILAGLKPLTAKVIPRGGPNDDETLRVTLVRGEGGWRVDSVHSSAPVGP